MNGDCAVCSCTPKTAYHWSMKGMHTSAARVGKNDFPANSLKGFLTIESERMAIDAAKAIAPDENDDTPMYGKA